MLETFYKKTGGRMTELGKFIKLSRLELGLSQIKFSEKLEVHPSLVCKWEKGQSTPTVQDLQKMYSFFGMDFSTVLFPKKSQPEDKLSQLERRMISIENQLERYGNKK